MSDNEDIQKTLEGMVKRSKTISARIAVAGIVLATVGFGIAVSNIFKLTEQQVIVSDSLAVKANVIDSLSYTTDSLVVRETRRDSVVKFIGFFLSPKPDSVIPYTYTDTVERYYLRSNYSLKQIQKERQFTQNRTPRAKTTYDPKDVSISIVAPDTVEVFVPTKYYADSLTDTPKDIIYQIKLNSAYRVFYVRNLLP
jgi:hypothetical protein